MLPTAWQTLQYAAAPRGGSLTVPGLGPIGEMSTRIARHLCVETVIGIDLVPERLERARARGEDVVDLAAHGKQLGDVVRGLTGPAQFQRKAYGMVKVLLQPGASA